MGVRQIVPVAFCVVLAGCATQKQMAWQRFDGQSVHSSPALEQQFTIDVTSCRANAVNAGAQVPITSSGTPSNSDRHGTCRECHGQKPNNRRQYASLHGATRIPVRSSAAIAWWQRLGFYAVRRRAPNRLLARGQIVNAGLQLLYAVAEQIALDAAIALDFPYFRISSCPASCRASTSLGRAKKTWMAGTSPAMTAALSRFGGR